MLDESFMVILHYGLLNFEHTQGDVLSDKVIAALRVFVFSTRTARLPFQDWERRASAYQ
jgi:hypothetical protein